MINWLRLYARVGSRGVSQTPYSLLFAKKSSEKYISAFSRKVFFHVCVKVKSGGEVGVGRGEDQIKC